MLRLLFAVLISLAVAGEHQNTGSVPDCFQGHTPGLDLEVSILSEDAAADLFREFASQKQIPFKYPIDGCYARATEMVRIAEKKGILFAKIYAEGNLRAKTELPRYPVVEWDWHVAPMAYVTNSSGDRSLMVFDPSLFSKPVSIEEWKNKMLVDGTPKPTIKMIYYGSKFQYGPGTSELAKGGWKQDDLYDTRLTLREYKYYEDLPGKHRKRHEKWSGTSK